MHMLAQSSTAPSVMDSMLQGWPI